MLLKNPGTFKQQKSQDIFYPRIIPGYPGPGYPIHISSMYLITATYTCKNERVLYKIHAQKGTVHKAMI